MMMDTLMLSDTPREGLIRHGWSVRCETHERPIQRGRGDSCHKSVEKEENARYRRNTEVLYFLKQEMFGQEDYRLSGRGRT